MILLLAFFNDSSFILIKSIAWNLLFMKEGLLTRIVGVIISVAFVISNSFIIYKILVGGTLQNNIQKIMVAVTVAYFVLKIIAGIVMLTQIYKPSNIINPWKNFLIATGVMILLFNIVIGIITHQVMQFYRKSDRVNIPSSIFLMIIMYLIVDVLIYFASFLLRAKLPVETIKPSEAKAPFSENHDNKDKLKQE